MFVLFWAFCHILCRLTSFPAVLLSHSKDVLCLHLSILKRENNPDIKMSGGQSNYKFEICLKIRIKFEDGIILVAVLVFDPTILFSKGLQQFIFGNVEISLHLGKMLCVYFSFRLHYTIQPRGQIIIENVKSEGMEKLPPKGAQLMIFPMHLKDGTGSPSRVIAVNDQNEGRPSVWQSPCTNTI